MTGGQDELAEDLKGDEPKELERIRYDIHEESYAVESFREVLERISQKNTPFAYECITIDNQRLRIRISRED